MKAAFQRLDDLAAESAAIAIEYARADGDDTFDLSHASRHLTWGERVGLRTLSDTRHPRVCAYIQRAYVAHLRAAGLGVL